MGDGVVQNAVGRHGTTLDAPFSKHDAAEAVGPRKKLRDAPRPREYHEVRGRALDEGLRGEAHRPRRS